MQLLKSDIDIQNRVKEISDEISQQCGESGQPPIITGNSEFMRAETVEICLKHGLIPEEWSSGMIKVLK